ncbi:MAG TPA: flippase [bacterium]|nr:flippase [bacterium]
MKSLTSKVALNTVVQTISKAIVVATSIVTISLLTRYLGEEGFGEYTTVMTYLGLFGIIVDMGIFLIVVREVSKEAADAEGIIGNVMGIRLLIGGVILALSPVIAVLFFPYSRQVDVAIAIGAIGFLFIALNQIVSAVFQVNLIMWKLMYGEVIGRVSILVLTYYFILLHGNLYWFIAANSLGNVILFIFSYYFARKYVNLLPKFEWQRWQMMLIETMPLAIVTLLQRVYFTIDTIFLSVFRTQIEVGIYGLPYKILDILISFPAIFAGLVFPTMSRLAIEKNYLDLKRIYHKAFDFLLIIVVPLFCALYVLSQNIVRLLGGEGFVDSVALLRILSVSVIFIFFTTLAHNLVIAIKQQKKLLLLAAISAVVNVVLNLWLIPQYSYWAAAGINVLTQSLVWVMSTYYVWSLTKIAPNFSNLGKILISAALMSVVIYELRWMNIFIIAVVGVVVYFGTMFAIKGISVDMIKNIMGKESQKSNVGVKS